MMLNWSSISTVARALWAQAQLADSYIYKEDKKDNVQLLCLVFYLSVLLIVRYAAKWISCITSHLDFLYQTTFWIFQQLHFCIYAFNFLNESYRIQFQCLNLFSNYCLFQFDLKSRRYDRLNCKLFQIILKIWKESEVLYLLISYANSTKIGDKKATTSSCG